MDKILIVDDEPDIREMVSYNLEKEGFMVFTAENGLIGLEMAKKENPDLIILDVMMPEMDGMEVCQELREQPKFADTVITFLSARSEDYSQIAGFESGADEYFLKPIRPKLLVTKIKALLKRKNKSVVGESLVSLGCISVDKDKRVVHKGENRIELPKKEYELLMMLGSKSGKVFSRENIYQTLWKQDLHVGHRTIDVHIRKLREKLGDDCIRTIKGVGYKYNEFCC